MAELITGRGAFPGAGNEPDIRADEPNNRAFDLIRLQVAGKLFINIRDGEDARPAIAVEVAQSGQRANDTLIQALGFGGVDLIVLTSLREDRLCRCMS